MINHADRQDQKVAQQPGKTKKTPGVLTADQALEAKANARLALRLGEARKARGLEAGELDLLIGARPGTAQRIEDGEEICSAAGLYQIGRVLGQSVGFFFSGIPGGDNEDPDGTPDMAKAREFADAFVTLENPTHRKAILEFVHAMSTLGSKSAKN